MEAVADKSNPFSKDKAEDRIIPGRVVNIEIIVYHELFANITDINTSVTLANKSWYWEFE